MYSSLHSLMGGSNGNELESVESFCVGAIRNDATNRDPSSYYTQLLLSLRYLVMCTRREELKW